MKVIRKNRSGGKPLASVITDSLDGRLLTISLNRPDRRNALSAELCEALLDALSKKQIAGAGLDVFDVEPLPLDHPYRKMDNVVITPHLGYVSQQNYDKYYPDIVENIRTFLDGKPTRVIAPR